MRKTWRIGDLLFWVDGVCNYKLLLECIYELLFEYSHRIPLSIFFGFGLVLCILTFQLGDVPVFKTGIISISVCGFYS